VLAAKCPVRISKRRSDSHRVHGAPTRMDVADSLEPKILEDATGCLGTRAPCGTRRPPPKDGSRGTRSGRIIRRRKCAKQTNLIELEGCASAMKNFNTVCDMNRTRKP
jgi:hypothetical protein